MEEIARLVEPQIPSLRRYAYALLRDRDAADDLVAGDAGIVDGKFPLRNLFVTVGMRVLVLKKDSSDDVGRKREKGCCLTFHRFSFTS